VKDPVQNIIIVGAGPAGIAAAIQLKRYGYNPILFEAGEVGGLLLNANLVENYPGFPGGVTGPELVERFKTQLEQLSISPRMEQVLEVEFRDGVFIVSTEYGRYHAPYLVAASGTRPNKLTGIEMEGRVEDRIFYYVYPLLGVSGKKLLIIGAGDAAFDYALNLSKQNRVTVLNRSDELKCLSLLWERAVEDPRIKYIPNTRVRRISEEAGGRLMVKCQTNEGTCEYSADYLIAAIGRYPNLEFLSESKSIHPENLASKGLLYKIGDVKNEIYRQTSIAVGDGVRAAMSIYLKGSKGENS
jgi:thioredoxin reductase (NADPH)